MAPTVEERRLRMLTAKKENLFEFIQKLYDLSSNLSDERSRVKFLSLVGSLESVKSDFVELVDEVIMLQLELDGKSVPNYDILDTVREMCGRIILAEKSLRANGGEGIEDGSSEKASARSPRLPKMELPTFSGDIQEWEQFYDLFKSLVHENPKLSAMDKLYYLMGCLRGQARNTCAGVAMSPENYEVAWDRLIQRYHDTRALASFYLGQILEWRDLRTESEKGLNGFLEIFDASVRALRHLKLQDVADFMFVHHALSGLNSETANYFEINRHSASVPQYEELVEFIKVRVKTLATSKSKILLKPKDVESFRIKSPAKSFIVNKEVNEPICPHCRKSGHSLSACSSFVNMNPKNRYLRVKDLNLCYNCFSAEHGVRNCPSAGQCGECSFRHHKLIHHEREPIPPSNPKDFKNSGVSLYSTGVKDIEGSTLVLLGTVEVSVESPLGCWEGRFLLDNGSQANLVSRRFCKNLGLTISKISSSVRGLGGLSQPVRGSTSFQVFSKTKRTVGYPVTALVVDKITGLLPQSKVSLRDNLWLKELQLADASFDQPGPVEGILGAEIFSSIVRSQHHRREKEGPIALETSLGYVVMGRIPVEEKVGETQTFLSVVDSPAVEDLVKQFWELEAVPEASGGPSEGEECENAFRKSFSRDETGRFTVALPFKRDPSLLGNSRVMAKRRFFALEAKLEKNLELKEAYHRAMEDFINQNHIYFVKNLKPNSASYYIPHHAVYKASSESTPVRIVLDASAPSDNGLSLNSLLHSGPKLQKEIFDILINFRLFSVAVVADIRQMYRQINLEQSQRKFQRLFWRWSPEDPLEVWELGTLAFGVRSSPYLALRCVKELLQQEEGDFPKTAEIIRESLYMDDLVVSVPSVEDSERLYSESIELLQRGQFELTKWVTNSEELLKKIPMKWRANCDRLVTFGSVSSILGVVWNPQFDHILIEFPVPSTECTKRSILSSVARCFDPLGVTAPLLLYLKILIKELWSLKLSWDEEAPPEIQRRWKKIQAEWASLRKLTIQRSLEANRSKAVNLFGFADASKDGYGGVIYTQAVDGDLVLRLVCARSRVSPMRMTSIPRLELLAALLLAKLMSHMTKILSEKIRVAGLFLFSDSSTVLQWLYGGNSKDTFVKNRVTQIKEALPQANWKHISGKDNPADGLSRGLSPAQLVGHKLWFQGPTWTKLPEEEWPCREIVSASEEMHILTAFQERSEETEVHPLLQLVDRKSSWSEILRITVWVLRWIKRIPKGTIISSSDLQSAERILIILVQQKHFGDDFRRLREGKDSSERLRRLRPFILEGALRVGGRLVHSSLSFENRHPYILPKREVLTERIIDHYHLKYFHTGPYLVETFLRRRFWILAGRSLIKKRIRVCNKCFRANPKSMEPLMANLPEQRVNPSKAFSETGVDYFGPINITLGRKRGAAVVKAYVALFVCMAVKAIHLELVSSLSTEHFLQAFKRFLSRRGSCKTLYSDRGTNFVGAQRVLSELTAMVQSKEYQAVIGKELSERRIQWKFNPAAAPHMGGIWESQVKVVKRHLMRVIGEQLLSYEELNTLLIQVEALLNSRPLCQLSADPEAPSALTPAHFLNSVPLEELPAEALLDAKTSRLNRLQLLDQMVQDFWKRWKLEYLTTLQTRHRWSENTGNLQIGSVVVLRVENTPPLKWPLAVITKVFPGRDGVVRTVQLRCGQKDLIRPAVKVCPLPTQ